MAEKREILIALGGNLPLEGEEPHSVLLRALDALAQEGLAAENVSSFYQTPCFPAGAGPDYVNAAARCLTERAASDILEILHRVESRFGRERISRWAGRTLDLDLLAVAGQIVPNLDAFAYWQHLSPEEQRQKAPGELILPHPRLQDRAFVLIPLKDVAPEWRHPVLGLTVAEMCEALPKSEAEAVVRL